MCLSLFLIFVLIGTLSARGPDIDINRIRLITEEKLDSNTFNSHGRRSVSDSYLETNDYVDHRRGYIGEPAPLYQHVSSVNAQTTKSPIKVHQPREDPRSFYQSDAYLKENNGQNVNNEVSFIYPGREVIRATGHDHRLRVYSAKKRENNFIEDGHNGCVRCPQDRTLVARSGFHKVLLQTPRLFACSGKKASRNVHFIQMYGPKFGSLLDRGSHLIVGRIAYKNMNIRTCKMQVHVIVQGCATPKYLISSCTTNNTCEFKCQNSKMHLTGASSLTCGTDLKWNGHLPVCRGQTWCDRPSPPDHGQLSCTGATAAPGPGLVEGSKCRVRCDFGWSPHPRAISHCRRGSWTQKFSCQKTNKHLSD